jgi:hypothetical protein
MMILVCEEQDKDECRKKKYYRDGPFIDIMVISSKFKREQDKDPGYPGYGKVFYRSKENMEAVNGGHHLKTVKEKPPGDEAHQDAESPGTPDRSPVPGEIGDQSTDNCRSEKYEMERIVLKDHNCSVIGVQKVPILST